jgi:steroid delta-isomerase-like uncharacterized protein
VEIPQVVRAYVEKFNPTGLDAWIATFAPDGTYSSPNVPKPTLARDLKKHFADFFVGFPDATFETVGLDAISDHVWVWRWVAHGTHTGSFRGLPATGHRIEVPGCEFIEIRNDHVVRAEGFVDRLTILIQLGLAPASAAGTTA